MIEVLDTIFIWSGRILAFTILWAIIISIGWVAFDKTRLAKRACHFIYNNRDEWIKFCKKEED